MQANQRKLIDANSELADLRQMIEARGVDEDRFIVAQAAERVAKALGGSRDAGYSLLYRGESTFGGHGLGLASTYVDLTTTPWRVAKRANPGPRSGTTLPRDEIEFDVRPGGFQRWTEVSAAQPELRVHIRIDLTDVADRDLLEGVMHVTGQLQDDIEPFETRFRVEFHDEPHGRTRIEIRQWLPAHLAAPSNQGRLEALEKLDATLLHIQAAATDAEV